MGIFDFSNNKHVERISELEKTLSQKEIDISQLKNENSKIKIQLKELQEKLSIFNPIKDIETEINTKKTELNKLISDKEGNLNLLISYKEKDISELNLKIELLEKDYQSDLEIYHKLKEQIKIYQNSLEPINYGLYEPIFNYETSEEFKEAIKNNNNRQKLLIKENKAITSNEDEIYYQTKYKFLSSSYKKSINSYKKLISIAFNSECDSLISKVKWNNVENLKSIIADIYYRINTNSREFCSFILLQNSIVNDFKHDKENFIDRYSDHMIEISKEFLELKYEELALHHEYQLKKQEEKEEERRIRELMREEEKAIRDYEKAQKEAEIEENKVKRAIEIAKKQISVENADYEILNNKIKELEEQLRQVQEYKERALSMAQQTKRGFIYVISNIGSFGENVYKIGMTRRLEPTDRVKELGDASVPFQFDIHAMIYSENAPSLENELHKAFADKKLNMLNYRKEFFKISLEEIESKIKELNIDVEFIKIPEAMQYRETQNILSNFKQSTENEIFEFNEIENFPNSLKK